MRIDEAVAEDELDDRPLARRWGRSPPSGRFARARRSCGAASRSARDVAGEARLDAVERAGGRPRRPSTTSRPDARQRVDARRRRRRRAGGARARPSSARGRRQWPSASASRERVQQPGVEAPGVVGRRAQAARERVGGGEADARRPRPPTTGRPAAARSRRGRARGRSAPAAAAGTPCSSRNSRTARWAPCASHDATAARGARADAGHLAQAPAGVAVELGQHALGPWRSTSHAAPRGPTCLTPARCASSAATLVASCSRTRSATSWRPWRGCSRQVPSTRTVSPVVDVRERPGDGDLVALVGDAGEHGEVLAVGPPADRGDLDRQGLPSDERPCAPTSPTVPFVPARDREGCAHDPAGRAPWPAPRRRGGPRRDAPARRPAAGSRERVRPQPPARTRPASRRTARTPPRRPTATRCGSLRRCPGSAPS